MYLSLGTEKSVRMRRSKSQASADCSAAKIGEGSGLGDGGREFLRPHVEQLGAGGQARAVIAVGAEDGVIDIHLLGEAVEGGARSMNAGRNALAIVGAEPLVAAGDVENGRIELLVEGFGKRFAEPFQTRSRRSILEGNHDQGVADDDAAGYGSSGGGAVLGAQRRAEKQRNHKDENSGAFHDKLIISAAETAHHAQAGFCTIPLATSPVLRIHCFFTLCFVAPCFRKL